MIYDSDHAYSWPVPLCCDCCKKVISVIGIPSGSEANKLIHALRCWQCERLVEPGEELELFQWVPMHQLLKYEVLLAEKELAQVEAIIENDAHPDLTVGEVPSG